MSDKLKQVSCVRSGLSGLTCLIVLTLGAGGMAKAQFPEDILRYSWQGLGVGARSLGLGSAGLAIADDYSAVYWNPAGLAVTGNSDFSFSLNFMNFANDATFMGSTTSNSASVTSLNHLGLVYAVPVDRGSFAIALGFDRSSEFRTGLTYNGFNPGLSIVQSWAPDGQPYPPDLTRAEVLGLALADTNTGLFRSPIIDSLHQLGDIVEGGGLHHWSFGLAGEVARGVYLGASFNFISGTYTYNSTFSEEDRADRYNTFSPDYSTIDYTALDVFDYIEGDLSGFTINAGMLFNVFRTMKLGFTVRTPSWMTIEEYFRSDAYSYFDNGDQGQDPADGDPGTVNGYDISTPWVFGAGVSGDLAIFTLAGSAEFIDYTQMEFSNAYTELIQLNNTIKNTFTATANLRAGVEMKIPGTGLALRGGAAYLPSPYDGDPAEFDRKYITAGVGFRTARTLYLELAWAHGWWESYRQLYSGTFTDTEELTTDDLRLTVSFRF